MTRGRKPTSPRTGSPLVNALFLIFDAAGLSGRQVSSLAGASPRLISGIRHGEHKRLMNPFALQLANVLGYKLALVPIEHPSVVLRAEHAPLQSRIVDDIQIETERLSHAEHSRTSPPPSALGHEHQHAAGC